MNEKENEDEEADEGPIRKRPRRGRLPRAPDQTTMKSATLKVKDSSNAEKGERKAEKSRSTSGVVKQQVNGHTSSRTFAKAEPHPPSRNPGTVSDESTEAVEAVKEDGKDDESEEQDREDDEDSEVEEKPEIAAKAREKVQTTLKSNGKDPHPDWKPGEPVPYAALCITFSLIELTTKRLVISAHCSLFLRQVLRLTPQDLLPTVQLMINKLAADYAGIELGIGESLIMKAIGESTGRSLSVIKADQNEIGDLGLVAAKSRSNQPTMFKPKPLTVRAVLDGLMGIATIQGDGAQGRKIAGIKKLLSAADTAAAGKGSKGIDITKDKGGASEAKFIIRFLEGKLRLGLAEKTVLVSLAHGLVIHEIEKNGGKLPSSEQLAKGEAILKTVYRYGSLARKFLHK